MAEIHGRSFYFYRVMKRYIIFYGLLAFSLLMLFQLSSMWLMVHRASTEWLLILVAIISVGIGAFYSKKGAREEADAKLQPFEKWGITEREFEVLQLINQGFSNKEVGEKLFISENTVKTHVSNLLVKLDARRRTQALKNAKELKIIA